MNAAVVTSRTFAAWDERGLVLTRLTGGLACLGDVDILQAGGAGRGTAPEGATTRHVFPCAAVDARRRRALEALTLGPPRDRPDCDCLLRARSTLAEAAGSDVHAELVALQGGASTELLEHLRRTRYDLVVFVGAYEPLTIAGIELLAGTVPTVVLPLAIDSPLLGLTNCREALERADIVAVASEAEAATVRRHAPEARVANIRAVLRVHDLALKNEPLVYEPRPTVVVASDWSRTPPSKNLVASVRRLNQELDGTVIVRLVGPGWERVPDDVRAPHADSRFDVWRWLVRALAVWEPNSDRILGREVLEALQYGTPVLATWKGAGHEHANQGDAGLWYRTHAELLAAIELLRDDEDATKTLGDQGRSYARATYGDTDAYIEGLRRLVVSAGA